MITKSKIESFELSCQLHGRNQSKIIRRFSLRPRLWLLLLILFMTALVSCQKEPEIDALKDTLTISMSSFPGYYPLFIARDKGFFEKHGVKINLILCEDFQGASFAAGNQDGAAYTLANMTMIRGRGVDIRVTFLISHSAGADIIVANPGIDTLADLKGKRIAAELDGYGEIFILGMLEKAGLTRNDVTMVNMSGADIPSQLKTDKIDVGIVWGPHIKEAFDAGAHVIFSSADTPYLILDTWAFHGHVLRDYPALVQAFGKGWFEAVDFWKAHPQEGNRIIGKALNATPESCSSEGLELFTLEDNRRLFGSKDKPGIIYDIANKRLTHFLKIGRMNRKVDLNVLLDPSFLPMEPPKSDSDK